jgi:hypothetical protein
MYDHLDAVGNTKPRMLGEYGSHDDLALGSKDQWLREVPAALRTALPKVKGGGVLRPAGHPGPG